MQYRRGQVQMKWLLKLHYCQLMVSSHFTSVPDDDMAGVQVENAEVQKPKYGNGSHAGSIYPDTALTIA